jgi:DNA-binding CsgD family transcriptional regulator/PAS domain-containing protein
MSSDQKILQLVDTIYEAAARPDSWQHFLSNLAEVCCCTTAVLFWRDAVRKQYDYTASFGMSPEYFRLYSEHFGEVDEWFKGGAGVLKTGWVGTGEMLCSERLLVKTEFYSDFLRPFDVFHQCGGIIQKQGSVDAAISLLRPRKAGEFGHSDVRTISTLMPHLQRAMQLHQKLTDLRDYGRTLEDALHQINLGIVLLNTKGEVVLFNEAAGALFERRDGLLIQHNKVVASAHRETAKLNALISAALNIKIKIGGGTMLISRSGERRSLSVSVTPMRNFDSARESSRTAAAILFITDPEKPVRIPMSLLTEGFGLTAAEGRLASLIAKGLSLTEACDICGVTRNTGRSELKRIFAKTHVQRQGELVKLLLGNAVGLTGNA